MSYVIYHLTLPWMELNSANFASAATTLSSEISSECTLCARLNHDELHSSSYITDDELALN
jgi:hypothetical protein